MPSSSTSRSSIPKTSASSIRSGIAALLLALLAAGTASAQAPTRAAGRVVRVSAAGDTIPVGDARVLLHRVGQDRQGTADSARTDAAGRFLVRFASDTTAIFFLTARYAGLEYFSPPLATDPRRPDTSVVIAVADTSARQPVTVGTRQIVITRPEDDGTRSVVDLIRLENAGPDTRVGRDTLSPAWAMPLPSDIFEFHVGPAGGGIEAVERRDDALVVLSPVAPGPTDLLVQYAIPAGTARFTVPLADRVERMEVLVEESGAEVVAGGLVLEESREVEGRRFHLWSGVAEAGAVVIALPATNRTARWALVALVASIAGGLALAAWLLRRRTPARPLPGRTGDVDALAEAAAALDRRYAGREAETAPEEWARYVAERARLKAQLATALARGTRDT